MGSPANDPLVGRTLSHYRVLERIGAGGMGVVYCAHDERLDRDVALKVLPEGAIADEEVRRRFRQEALALSKVNHPHIATIHDFDRDDGVDFLVMELVPGTSLDQRIRAGGLPEDEVRRLGTQLADGLVALHECRIVHRDIKPGNLRLTPDGRLKILDFGLARLLRAADKTTATLTGTPPWAGTVPYMAPEQVRGEETDARTDIYAAGAVLFELATGRTPFAACSGPEQLGAILGRPPDRPTTTNPRLSSSMERIILKALAKDPAERFPSAADLRGALSQSERIEPPRRRGPLRARWAAIAALVAAVIATGLYFVLRAGSAPSESARRIAIAVLPFHAAAVPDSVRFLAVGIPDAIITRLAAVRQLMPRPTSAILQYADQTIDPKEVGEALASEYVLTGLLQQVDDRVRISVQLVRASDRVPIWGNHYDISRSDLLTLQDQIAQSVAEALQVQMSDAERERLSHRYTNSGPAYERYLMGRARLRMLTERDALRAIAEFEAARDLDPRFAPAFAGLAAASAQMRVRFSSKHGDALWDARAREEARRALDLDPDLAEAYEALAAIHRFQEFDWDAVIRESRRALELNRNLDMPHLYLASAYFHIGLFEEAEREVQAAREINPERRAEPSEILGAVSLYAGRMKEATAHLTPVQDLSDSQIVKYLVGLAHYYQGEQPRAESLLETMIDDEGPLPGNARATLAAFRAARGADAEARALAARVASEPDLNHHAAYGLGAAHAQLLEPATALRWLTQAATTGFPCYPWYARDPLLDPIRNDTRFAHFMGELRRSWEAARSRYASSS